MKLIRSELMILVVLSGGLVAAAAEAKEQPGRAVETKAPAFSRACADGIVFHEVRYQANLGQEEARFQIEVTAESMAKEEVSANLFEGELALLPPRLPAALRIERERDCYKLFVSKPGRFQFQLELAAKVRQADPWNQVSFKGPPAAIGSVSAQAAGTAMDLQLLSGTLLATAQTNGSARVKGFLGSDPTVALRWSRAGGAAEVARKAVVTAETSVEAHVTPTVIKYATQLRFEIIQGKMPLLRIRLPAAHSLTRLVGEQIRDWEIKPASAPASPPAAKGESESQILEVQFIKPLEGQYELKLFSEQTVENTPSTVALLAPEPIELARESGSLTISAEDTLAEPASLTGLRQMNAPVGSFAAYRFNARPFSLSLNLQRIEPVISLAERVAARIEETRLLSSHSLAITVEKAGIYALELLPPGGFLVADVQGEGVEDWKVRDLTAPDPGPGDRGRRLGLRVNFSNRVTGARKLEVRLEQPLKDFPDQISLASLQVTGAAHQSAEIGVASAAGIRLKTAELAGLREVPIRSLQGGANANPLPGSDELLGYKTEQAGWKLTLASERLPARVVADVFNLITIGDGIVGGSATIRYGVINQGVQQFEISLPAAWKNVEFTGPNIRRKEPTGNGTWLIGLQDKVWGGYTLVVTYDYPFDPKGASFAVGGIHALGVERETGSVALTTAASLKLTANSASDSLRRVDEMELSASDRALITRSVLLAYQYEEPGYKLDVEVKRFDEANVLSAVADRTQLTTVLTEAGEMLTQASFMVKNNDKQFQRFKLPTGSRFWNCHVNGQPVKAEQDGAWLMAPLPRGANRDQAFAVDIVYAEKKGVKPGWRSGAFTLEAPQTDVPNTYAEWQLFAPAVFRLSGFAGNMTPLRGTTYDFQEAWQRFTRFYWEFLHEAGPGLFMAGTLVLLLVALIASAIRRGVSGIITVLVVFSLVAILAAMLLPALARAKSRAQRISAVNNLKQIGLACRTWALDNGDRLPMSFEDMMNELGTDKVTYDPESGQRFVYMGGGQQFEQIQPDSIIAYSPTSDRGSRAVLMADGSVQQMSNARFDEMSRRGFIVPATAQQVAQNQQLAAVRSAQLQPATAQPAAVGAAPATPRVRSIRIDIPREGQAFTFTKVLNAGRVPLAVQLKIMKLQTFQTMQMSLQLGAFVSGLLLCWWQWRRARNTFLLTLGLALALGAVGNLLLAWRSLHLAFIWVTPLLLLAGLARLTWRFWPRPQPAQLRSTTGFEPGLPPAMAGIALLFFSTLMNGNLAAAQAKSAEDALAPKVSILSAAYIGTVNEHVAQLVATLRVSSSQPGQKVFLFGEDVAVQQFSAHPRDVRLERDGKGVAVTLGHRGEANLRLQLLVKLGGDVTRRQLAFAIPPALSSSLALTIEQPEAVVEFPAAIALKRATANQQTQVEAVIGSAERVDLRWTPRVKRAAEIAANVICRNSTLVRFAGGALNARAQFDYQVTQGEMRHARVRLPAGHRLLRVEGEAIRTWDLKTENGDQNVLVELLKGIAPNYRLTIETEKPLEKLPALMQAEIPHALDVKRETGLLALQGDEELELAVENSSELVRVDVEEFGRSIAQKPEAALNAFRFLKPDFSLQVRVGVMQPEVEAVLRNFLRVGQDQVSLSATVDYTVKRAGLFGLKLVLPDGYRLETVSGTNILQWAERQETGRRFLEISLKERTAGSYPLRLNLVRNLNELPKTLPIAGVHPLGTQKLTGFVSVSVEPGVGIKPEASEGLTEIPAGTLTGGDAASGSAVLAYKFIAGAPQPAPAWTLAVQTEAVESWVRAEIVNTLTVADTLVSGRAVARFEIQNAPVKELRFRIPARFKNVEISGANIRRRDHDGEKWTVEFQSKIRGAHILNVTWEEPRRLGTSQAELEGVAADGVERETGLLAVIARPPLQVTGQQPGDLQPIDLRELPDWAGQPDEATVLAYRYLRPGYKLAVEAKRFNEAEALQALVESLLISTVVAEDGQMMTQLTLSVRNQGRQHLEIALPSGVTNVWSAFVAGQPVRPGIKEGKLLLPLEQSVGDDAPVTIEVVYVGSSRFPQNRGPIDLISPRLDAPLKSARWELFLPMDYTYSGFSGTMAHEVEAALADPSSFSYLDYSSRESKNKAELAKELKSELISAKKKLSSGNVKEALADYNRARAKGDLSTTRDDDTKQLEADLRRAQGSNLIEAQNAFSLSNGAQPGQRQHPVGGQQATQYDAAAAEAQWTKLQQAQEIGRAKVQPIRVTLPTRGLRHSFTQVLQTEPGKELTIHLVAANAHTVSWPKRIIGPAASFLALWVVVALIARRRTAASSPAVA